jgi:methionine sulfoxide reductase heme-binding subunit
VLALLTLFFMAATSHDFWLKNLSPSVWKALHMLVYPAYGLLVLHVTLGALHSEESSIYVVFVGVGLMTVVGLHLGAGWWERLRDGQEAAAPEETSGGERWIDVGLVDEIPESRAKVICLDGCERVAVFRYAGRVSAVTNVCAHQRGPLGEGKVIDGCVTCPWHGWQYLPENGQSPPPFQERIATYRVRVKNRRVFLDIRPLPPGTPVEPAVIEAPTHEQVCTNAK